MKIKDQIQSKIDELQKKIDQLNRMPEDSFDIGTILVFAFLNNAKGYILKVGDEFWENIRTRDTRPLHEWILAYTSEQGKTFDIYVMTPQKESIYTTE